MATLPSLPRVALLHGPTPLHPLPRLTAELGGRAELWIKREDLGPLAFSGNKVRNLEFLLGAAIEDGVDAIVTSGRRWSNHCRLAASAGARLGLEVHIVVSGPPEPSANLRLMESLGASVHQAVTDDREERERLVDEVRAGAAARGRRVAVLPVGGSEPIGAWGQVLAALEAIEQAEAAGSRPDVILVPTATGGTQAGLVVGATMVAGELRTSIAGIAVHPDPALRPKVERLVTELAGIAGVEAPTGSIDLDVSQIGPGYGQPTPGSQAAAAMLARTEGILVDPIYGAKALAGLVERTRTGAFDGRRVVFWHGGGLPALFEGSLGEAATRPGA